MSPHIAAGFRGSPIARDAVALAYGPGDLAHRAAVIAGYDIHELRDLVAILAAIAVAAAEDPAALPRFLAWLQTAP